MSLAERTWERRRLRQEIRQLTHHGARQVDFASSFQMVERGGAFSQRGLGLRPVGSPLHVGARLDTLTRTWVGAAQEPPAVIYYSASQAQALSFGLDESSPIRRMVLVGSAGSGKTEIGARWLVRIGMHFRNCMIGVIAPTGRRLGVIWKKLRKLLRPSWIADLRVTDGEIELVNGVVFKFVSAKIYSADVGSPLAGLDLAAAFADEEQDVDDEAMAELEARGRDAPGGYFPLLSSCTLKDTPGWRARKARYDVQPGCVVHRMLIADSPFVDPKFLEQMRHAMSARAYRMRIEALEAPPERATYYTFGRGLHVRALPQLGIRDVTAKVVGASTLVGYDPGSLCDTSIILRAYHVLGAMQGRPDWWVIWWVLGEVVTRPGDPERHARDLSVFLWDRLQVRPQEAVVVADPHGNSESKPHVTVYRQLQLRKFRVRPAAYKAGSPAQANKPGQIPKDARIFVVNGLLLDSSDETRLYIDCDDRGNACAPQLVASLEMSERDEGGRAEQQKKGDGDVSHPTAALGYGLYPWEHPRFDVGHLKENGDGAQSDPGRQH